MIIDTYGTFCDNTTMETGTSATLIGDTIPVSVVRNQGGSRPIYLVIRMNTTAAGGTGPVNFKLMSDATNASFTPATASEHWGATYTVAQLAASTTVAVLPLPSEGIDSYEEHLGLVQTNTASITQGKVDAFLTLDPTAWTAHPDATN